MLEKYIDPYLLGDLRHYASRGLSEGELYGTYGLLSPGERKLCKTEGMVLPRPIRPERSQVLDERFRIYDKDFWACRIGSTVDGDGAFGVAAREGSWNVPSRPTYIVNGVFDVFHGGQKKLVDTAISLAEQNNGYVYILVEPNEYVMLYKNKFPIFDEITRAGWFANLSPRIDGILVWSHNKSWVSGYNLLKELVGTKNLNKIHFVMQDTTEETPINERVAVLRRQIQIQKAGFSIAPVRSAYIDTTSSKIRKKFNLRPTDAVRLRKRGYFDL